MIFRYTIFLLPICPGSIHGNTRAYHSPREGQCSVDVFSPVVCIRCCRVCVQPPKGGWTVDRRRRRVAAFRAGCAVAYHSVYFS